MNAGRVRLESALTDEVLASPYRVTFEVARLVARVRSKTHRRHGVWPRKVSVVLVVTADLENPDE